MYGIYINSANQWVFRGTNGDVVGPAVTQSAWTHVAVVQNGPTNTRSIYINGVLAATGPAQAADGAGQFWMGQQNVSGTPDSFPGLIDEVRIYNIALGASDITNLMGPPILEASSVMTQGTAGTFGLVIYPTSVQIVEPREGTPAGTYTLVLTFGAPVSGLSATLGLQGGGTPAGASGGTPGTPTVSYDSTKEIVTVGLTNVGNVQKLNLHLSGIQPGNATADIPFNVLWGDVNGDNVTNSVDQGIVSKSTTTQVNSTSAFFDINGDGAVNSSGYESHGWFAWKEFGL